MQGIWAATRTGHSTCWLVCVCELRSSVWFGLQRPFGSASSLGEIRRQDACCCLYSSRLCAQTQQQQLQLQRQQPQQQANRMQTPETQQKSSELSLLSTSSLTLASTTRQANLHAADANLFAQRKLCVSR